MYILLYKAKTSYFLRVSNAFTLLFSNWKIAIRVCSRLNFSKFSCMFLNSNIFFPICVLRNLQEQVKKPFCYQKLFWPFTVWINCSSDLKNFANSRPLASNFQKFSWMSRTIFFHSRGQNNFGNKIPFLIFTWDHFNDSKLFFSSNQLIMKYFSLHSSEAANYCLFSHVLKIVLWLTQFKYRESLLFLSSKFRLQFWLNFSHNLWWQRAKPCPFGLGLRKFALDPTLVNFFKECQKKYKCWLIRHL